VTCFVVIAAHILDDNFFQPQPGTSAGDHLVSGLVPSAVFLGAAVAFPHLGAGLQATLALMLGVLGVVIGASEAGYYTLEEGPSGDDYTGLLAIPAGLLLVGVGLALTWRTRPRGGFLRASSRWLLLLLGAALVLVVFVLPLSVAYVFTHASRAEVPPPNLGAVHENGTFKTNDGLTLRGWYVPSRSGRCGGRLPRPQVAPAPDADAGPSRLRRAAVRPTRGGRERRRPEHLQLGDGSRPEGGGRVPPAPAGSRPQPVGSRLDRCSLSTRCTGPAARRSC
jgi:hypothetical protein